MIKVYSGIKGIAVLFLFVAGVVLFLSVFFWGIAKAIELILPLLIIVSYLLIIVFLLGFLPVSFNKHMRPLLSTYSLLMSQALGGLTWVMSFIFVTKAFGFWGVCLSFFFQFLAPIALLAAALKGAWHIAFHLSVWICFTFMMKFYSQWLLSFNFRQDKKNDIIDVDVIEVRES